MILLVITEFKNNLTGLLVRFTLNFQCCLKTHLKVHFLWKDFSGYPNPHSLLTSLNPWLVDNQSSFSLVLTCYLVLFCNRVWVSYQVVSTFRAGLASPCMIPSMVLAHGGHSVNAYLHNLHKFIEFFKILVHYIFYLVRKKGKEHIIECGVVFQAF